MPLVLLADVEQQRPVFLVEALVHVDGGDLVDVVLDLREKLSVRSHYFPEYSDAWVGKIRARLCCNVGAVLVFPATVRP